MDDFVAEKTNGTLQSENDEDTDKERDMEEELCGFTSKQAHQPVPGNGTEPLHRSGD